MDVFVGAYAQYVAARFCASARWCRSSRRTDYVVRAGTSRPGPFTLTTSGRASRSRRSSGGLRTNGRGRRWLAFSPTKELRRSTGYSGRDGTAPVIGVSASIRTCCVTSDRGFVVHHRDEYVVRRGDEIGLDRARLRESPHGTGVSRRPGYPVRTARTSRHRTCPGSPSRSTFSRTRRAPLHCVRGRS